MEFRVSILERNPNVRVDVDGWSKQGHMQVNFSGAPHTIFKTNLEHRSPRHFSNDSFSFLFLFFSSPPG